MSLQTAAAARHASAPPRRGNLVSARWWAVLCAIAIAQFGDSDLYAEGLARCRARAELVGGDRSLVDRVGAALTALGVERGPAAPGCRAVYAVVERDGNAIAVAIRDASRRSEGRVVGDEATAAAWIDSWLHDDELDGAQWLAARPTAVPAAAITEPQVTARAPRDVPAPAGREPSRPRIAIDAGYETTWVGNGAANADGVTASACINLGRACFGVRARYAREGERKVEVATVTRDHGSLVATGSIATTIGRMTLAPELGVGVGRTATRSATDCKAPVPPNCSPNDPTCVTTCADPNTLPFKFSTTTYAPRASATLRVAIPIFDHFSVAGTACVMWAPLGHSDPFTVDLRSPDNSPGGRIEVPGEPATTLSLGVGLAVEL